MSSESQSRHDHRETRIDFSLTRFALGWRCMEGHNWKISLPRFRAPISFSDWI